MAAQTFDRQQPSRNQATPLPVFDPIMFMREPPRNAPDSGLLHGTHVWAGFGTAASTGAAFTPDAAAAAGATHAHEGSLPPTVTFPHFRVKHVLTNESPATWSPPADPSPESEVPENRKRPAATPAPCQGPKKRGRPSRKDKAEAATAAAVAAAAAASATSEMTSATGTVGPDRVGSAVRGETRSPDTPKRKLLHILPKASWTPLDCATESAAVMLRQHKARQLPAASGAASMSMLAGLSFQACEPSSVVPYSSCQTPAVRSASAFADAPSEAHSAPCAPLVAHGPGLPALPHTTNHVGPTGQAASLSPAEPAAPAPCSTPALDWLMSRFIQHRSASTSSSPLFFQEEKADEWNPSPSLGFSGQRSLGGMLPLSATGSTSSWKSKPPAAVMAAAAALLARHGEVDSRLGGLPGPPTSMQRSGMALRSLSQVLASAPGCSESGQPGVCEESEPVRASQLDAFVERASDAERNVDLELHL